MIRQSPMSNRSLFFSYRRKRPNFGVAYRHAHATWKISTTPSLSHQPIRGDRKKRNVRKVDPSRKSQKVEAVQRSPIHPILECQIDQ